MDRVDKVFKKIYAKISINFKIAFISAVILGLMAHLYMFTNKLPNYDDMALNGFGATFRLGRWFLWVLGAAAYHLNLVYSIPFVNGLISIVLLAVCAGIIADLMKLENKIAVVIIAGILVVFPSWTATYFFMFTAPYYAIAVFLMTLSVYSCKKYKYGYIFSIFCIALSMGIYQAYLPFGATLYVVILVLELYKNDADIKQVFLRAVKYFAILAAGVIVYYVLMKASLLITDQQLADYKGTRQMGELSLSLIPQIITRIFNDGFGVAINNNLELSYNFLLKFGYAVLYFIDAVMIVLSCVHFIKRKEYARTGMFLLFMTAFFIAVNSIFIMCPTEGAVYVLMTYAYTFLIILPIGMVDKLLGQREISWKKSIICMEYGIIGISFLMVLNYIHFANAQYLSMQLSLEQATSFYTGLITQVKSVEGYSDAMPVAIIENDSGVWDKTLYRNDVMNVFDISGRDEVLAETYNKEDFLAYYCGFAPEYVNADNISKEITDAMPVYPLDGSIQVVDNIVVIKLSQ